MLKIVFERYLFLIIAFIKNGIIIVKQVKYPD
jgi:hypothetical protein